MAACKKCGADLEVQEFSQQAGDQECACPKCGAQHIVRRAPSPEGRPGRIEVELADTGPGVA